MFTGTELVMNITSENLSRNQEANGPVGVDPMARDENLARVEIATLAIIFLVTVIGNSTVLLALWIRRRGKTNKSLETTTDGFLNPSPFPHSTRRPKDVQFSSSFGLNRPNMDVLKTSIAGRSGEDKICTSLVHPY